MSTLESIQRLREAYVVLCTQSSLCSIDLKCCIVLVGTLSKHRSSFLRKNIWRRQIFNSQVFTGPRVSSWLSDWPIRAALPPQKTLLEGSQRASRIGWGMKKDRWHELRCVAWKEQLAQAARVKIGCANCAETTGGTATRIFEETRAAWSLLHPHGGQEDGFHAFSCTEGHTWEGKPGSISRGCLGFLVCLQSRRCYTFFFSIFFFFFGDRVPQISIQMLNKIVNQRESWRGMHWN